MMPSTGLRYIKVASCSSDIPCGLLKVVRDEKHSKAMNHAVIVAHPNPQSFTLAVANAYAEVVQRSRGRILLRDLYRMDFNPCLAADELFGALVAPRPDVIAERQLLADIDVFTFIYPLWYNAAPAILKGYMDRVFGLGFAYRAGAGDTEPMLSGRRMMSFTTGGAPGAWLRESAALRVSRRLIDEYFADVCGLKCIDRVHFDGVVPDSKADEVAQNLALVRSRVEQLLTQPR
jgi:NAD(P)H dehydrogenase (quinone)